MGYTRAEYRQNAEDEYNMPAQRQSTLPMMNRWIEEARQRTWDALLKLDENYGVVLFPITVTNGSELYDLPSDFRVIMDLVRVESNVVLNYLVAYGSLGVTGALQEFSYGYENYTIQGNQILIRSGGNNSATLIYKQDVKTFATLGAALDSPVTDNAAGTGLDAVEDTFLPNWTQHYQQDYVAWKLARRGHSTSTPYYKQEWKDDLKLIRSSGRRLDATKVINDAPAYT